MALFRSPNDRKNWYSHLSLSKRLLITILHLISAQFALLPFASKPHVLYSMPDDQVLFHAAYTVPDSFNYSKSVQKVQFMEIQIRHPYWYNITFSCGLLLLVVYEIVFAHELSLIPLPALYPWFSLSVRPISIFTLLIYR